MIGKIISTTIKVVTLPVDMANAASDLLAGGDGSKKSRNDYPAPLSMIEQLRDSVCESAEKIDREE